MRLKFVTYADFRSNENTLAKQYSQETSKLRPNECVLFISKKGDQLRFVFRPEGFLDLSKGGSSHTILQSRLYRILYGGTWSPLMLKNYAQKVGLDLEGLKSFEEHYSDMQEKKAKERKAKLKEKQKAA